MNLYEIVGAVGIVISALAYLPQVVHLAKEHCSAGISGRAWAMWLTSSVLVGALALHRRDPVFIALQASSLTSAAIIVYLARRYRGMVCEAHAHLRPHALRARHGRSLPDTPDDLRARESDCSGRGVGVTPSRRALSRAAPSPARRA